MTMRPRLRKKLFPKLSWKAALLLVVTLLAVLALIGLLFLRRVSVEYEPKHTFSVRDPVFLPSALALANPIPAEGNKIELLHNGDQIFPAMLKAIHGAKKSINFEAFLFHSGEVGSQFRDALCERARAGVKVRVLLDGIGSGRELKSRDVDVFTEAGCSFSYYNPTRSWRTDRLNRRSHRRILVVDGKVGFTGGAGFADEWLGNADSKDHWREVHARLEGPVVAQLQSAFLEHWIKETGEVINGADEFPALQKVGALRTQTITTSSHTAAPLALALSVAFASAEKSILITNAYCAPGDSHVRLLIDAVKRGVDVRLLLPGEHNDQPMTKAAGRTAYKKLLEGGVKIFEYTPTMIHSKTVVVDGLFSVFGSSNFDARSAQINEELDIAVYDEGFGQMMKEVFEKDIAQSREYRIEDFRQRSLWDRFSEWAVQPFHSQL